MIEGEETGSSQEVRVLVISETVVVRERQSVPGETGQDSQGEGTESETVVSTPSVYSLTLPVLVSCPHT